MKRNNIIIMFFLLCFLILCLLGCRVGSNSCEFQGLLSNKLINIPKSCYEYNYDKQEFDVNSDDIELTGIKVMANSDGNGENGHITARVGLRLNYLYIDEVAFSVRVYDNNEMVGEVYIIRSEGQIYKVSKEKKEYEVYFNIPVKKYNNGDYYLEIFDLKVYGRH